MNAIVSASGVAALVITSAASAAVLPLTGGTPDVASGFVAVSYNASTHVFTANGFTQTLTGHPGNLGSRQFQLTASIDNAGQIISGGTFSLTVRGDYGGTNQLLYSSTSLSPTPNFLSGATDRFEFVFLQQAGSLAPVGSELGTILVGNFGSFPGGVPVRPAALAPVMRTPSWSCPPPRARRRSSRAWSSPPAGAAADSQCLITSGRPLRPSSCVSSD
jgi:hypothetical protein